MTKLLETKENREMGFEILIELSVKLRLLDPFREQLVGLMEILVHGY